MSFLKLSVAVLALILVVGFCACTFVTKPLSAEETQAIRQNFEHAVVDRITQHEGKKIKSFTVDDLKQTRNNEVHVAYHVTYLKNVDGGELANVTFNSKVTLKRDDSGTWAAVGMDPDQLTLEFTEGAAIKAAIKPRTPASSEPAH